MLVEACFATLLKNFNNVPKTMLGYWLVVTYVADEFVEGVFTVTVISYFIPLNERFKV